MRSSVTRILPVALTVPAIACGVTISTSIPWLCPVGGVSMLAEVFAAGGVDFEHPPHIAPMASDESNNLLIDLRLNIFTIFRAVLRQRRSGRQLEIKQRHLVIKNGLVKAG